MKKSVLLISLLSGTALALSDAAVASGIYATHTRTPRPEPVSFADMAHAYKTASVCFLGTDNCGVLYELRKEKGMTAITKLIRSNSAKTKVLSD